MQFQSNHTTQYQSDRAAQFMKSISKGPKLDFPVSMEKTLWVGSDRSLNTSNWLKLLMNVKAIWPSLISLEELTIGLGVLNWTIKKHLGRNSVEGSVTDLLIIVSMKYWRSFIASNRTHCQLLHTLTSLKKSWPL